jgi:glycosyltransferase involved in cell wall biosynthesis
MPELIHDDITGYLANPRDVDELATLVDKIVGDESDMGPYCREYVKQNHSFQDIAEKYIEVYNQSC